MTKDDKKEARKLYKEYEKARALAAATQVDVNRIWRRLKYGFGVETSSPPSWIMKDLND